MVNERRRAAQPRALRDDERSEVLDVLHSGRFVDESRATVWATLLDGSRYLARHDHASCPKSSPSTPDWDQRL